MSEKIGRREFLKQGSLAGVAVTGLVDPAVLRAGPGVSDGPLDAIPAASPVPTDRQLDSRDFTLSVYDRTAPALSFTAREPDGARQWQRGARARLTELLGGFPARRAELRPEVLERRDLGGYVRERVVFQTRDDLSAIGYLLIPKERPGPAPAIVCLPGHGRGADDAVGLTEDGSQRTERSTGYAKDFAVQAVEKGYVVFALEQLAFGARRDAAARRSPSADSCRPAACAALLFGETMLGWRVWDVMRTLDYLATRPEVDAGRLATMGISGGGTVSLFAAALDERIKAAVVSCYFNTFRDSIVSLSHCPDNYVPGILNFFEMYDLSGLVAPRFFFAEAGSQDRIFPIAGARTAIGRAEEIYRAFGVPERMAHQIFDGGHEFHGVGAFEFLRRHL